MYERIIVNAPQDGFKDGSSSLPSSLVFTSRTQYQDDNANNLYSINSEIINSRDSSKLSSRSISDNKPGTIADNVFEFIMDFPDFKDEYKDIYFVSSNSDQVLYTLYKNYFNSTIAIRFNKYYLIDSGNQEINNKYNSLRLKCIQLPDYSMQAMTMKNYDMFIKMFNSNGEKLPNSRLAIIKSYTFKRAWILYEPIASFIPSKIIIDFHYKKVKNESSSYLKYENYNNYSNIQDYLNISSIRSPYFDKFWNTSYASSNNTKKYLLNKQNTYFSFNYEKGNISKTKFTFSNMLARSNQISANTETTNLIYFKTASNNPITNLYKYTCSLDYEVYSYTNLVSLGTRCMKEKSSSITEKTSSTYYEIFPIMKGLVHFIFCVTDNGTVNIDQLKQWMKNNKIYLFNYNITNLNEFTINKYKYVEFYANIPIDGETHLTEVSDGTVTNISLPNNLDLSEYASFSYDPSNIYSYQYYYNDSDSVESLMPYISVDNFVNPLLTDNEVRYVDFENEDSKKDTLDWKDININLFDYNFDVLPVNSTISPKLNETTIKSYFSGTGYRDAENSTLLSIFDNNETVMQTLKNNFANMIGNETVQPHEKIVYNDGSSFLFLYFDYYQPQAEIKYTLRNSIDGENNITFSYIEKYTIKQNDKYIFIIPCMDFYSKVELPDNYYDLRIRY